jgi:hypothetical protein
MGAFVVAENAQTKMTVSVLSNQDGSAITSAICRPRPTSCGSRPIGYKSEPRNDVQLAADQKTSFDFALEKIQGAVGAISVTYQGRKLCPRPKEHDLSHNDALFTTCFQSCHSVPEAHGDRDLGRERLARTRDLYALT